MYLLSLLTPQLRTTQKVNFHLATTPEMQKVVKVNYYIRYLVGGLFVT
jgi:hypothetical protein